LIHFNYSFNKGEFPQTLFSFAAGLSISDLSKQISCLAIAEGATHLFTFRVLLLNMEDTYFLQHESLKFVR